MAVAWYTGRIFHFKNYALKAVQVRRLKRQRVVITQKPSSSYHRKAKPKAHLRIFARFDDDKRICDASCRNSGIIGIGRESKVSAGAGGGGCCNVGDTERDLNGELPSVTDTERECGLIGPSFGGDSRSSEDTEG